MENNKLTTNKGKIQIMITNGMKKFESFTWNQNTIELKRAVKYLGLILDQHVTFNQHIESVRKKCNPFISIFYQTRQFLSSSVLIRIYKQFIQPIYQYGVLEHEVAKK